MTEAKKKGKKNEEDKDFHYTIAQKIIRDSNLKFINGRFHQYERGVWSPIPDENITAKIRKILKSKGKIHTVKEIYEMIKYYDSVFVENKEALAKIPHHFINLKNCLFNTKTFQPVSHTSDIFTTTQLPVTYDKDAQCPQWEAFLEEIFFGNETKIESLQEWFGYTLIPSTEYQKFLLLYGDGSNGKSTVIFVWKRLIGFKNLSNISPSKFGGRFVLGQMVDKLVNFAADATINRNVQIDTLKELASGDTISVEMKHVDPFDYYPITRLVFATNHLPDVEDKTRGWRRRLMIINFTKDIPDEKIKSEFQTEESPFLKELSGILNWSIEGLRRLKKRKRFLENKAINDNEVQSESSQVERFFDYCCEIQSGKRVKLGVLYKTYLGWLSEIKERPEYHSDRAFNKALEQRYPEIEKRRIGGKAYYWENLKFHGHEVEIPEEAEEEHEDMAFDIDDE